MGCMEYCMCGLSQCINWFATCRVMMSHNGFCVLCRWIGKNQVCSKGDDQRALYYYYIDIDVDRWIYAVARILSISLPTKHSG